MANTHFAHINRDVMWNKNVFIMYLGFEQMCLHLSESAQLMNQGNICVHTKSGKYL